MTTLLTGFEPFGEMKINSSELVVKALAAANEPDLVTAILPTSYRQAEKRMAELLHLHNPSIVLMLGLSQNATNICLEQVALNLNDANAPDNDGEVRLQKRIVEQGPVGYWSTLEFGAMAEAARDLGEEVVLSRDAGSYVCNHVFFSVAHSVAARRHACRFGFVHLPSIKESEERLARFVEIVRRWVATHRV
ncbi:MAG: pyroglutamyl-peptidase I, partial [Micropepsaceae bacterium]